MTPRAYEQRLRAESAAATRARILDALFERIRSKPSRPVSVEETAALAGVARSTIYAVFGSRAGMFDALARELFERGGYRDLLDAVAEPDPRETLRAGIAAGVHIFASAPEVFRALHSMERLDADAVGGAIARIEEKRAGGMASLAKRLKRAGELRDGVTAARAAHVLWIAASFEAFDLLYAGRGLEAEQVAEVLVEGAERAICAGP